MANRIQLRRDTSANWTRVNPILEDGEPGLEIDTNYIKYGDGNTPWVLLAYASTGGSGSVSFTYSTVQEGGAGPGNVTSITGNVNTGVSLTSDQWAQLMWVPSAANTTIADIGNGPATYNWAYVDSTGFRVESNVANVRSTWGFYANSLLTTPGNVQIGNVATYGNISYVNTISANNYVFANGVSILSGISGNTGSITFDGIKMIGANIGGGSAEIELVPDNTGDFYANGQYVRIYPTRAVPDSPHIHIDSGSGGDLILGNDQRGVDINHDANVYIRTDQYAGAYNWQFGADGNLTLPNGTRIDASTDGYGIGLTTDRGTILFGNRPEIGQLNHFHIMKADPTNVDLFFGDDTNYLHLPNAGGVEIGAGGPAWTFSSNGNLSLPAGLGVIGAIETTDSVDLYGDINTQYVQLNYNNQNFVYVDTSGAHMQAGPTAPGEYEIWLSVDGSTTFPDHKPVSITGNLTVGNLIVNGNTTTINTTSYSVTDNIIQMAVDNPADTLDIGFVGHRTVNSSLQHTGLVRDASTGLWKLFSNVAAQPGTTVDFTGVVYDDLQLDKLFADTIHLSGTPPSTNTGAEGDLVGDIHIDGNFLYYCSATYVDQHYSAMSNTAYTMDNVWHIDKGDYPTPQVGWTITGTSYPMTQDYTTTITGVVDEGSTWGITGAGIGNNGVIARQAVTFFNPVYPAIWKTIPLSAFGTAEYTNTSVATFLSSYTGSLGNLRVLNTYTPVTAGGNVGDLHGQVRIDSDYLHVTTGAYGQQSYVVTAFATQNFASQYYIALAKGAYPKPQSGWEITRDGWGTYHTIDAEPVDYGDYWWCSISSYSTSYPAWSAGDNVVLRGTTSTVWKSIPLNTFKTATTGTYSNSNVASYLVDNPQSGTYSNTNVAAYLTSTQVPNAANVTIAAPSTPNFYYTLTYGNIAENKIYANAVTTGLRYNPVAGALIGATTGTFATSVQTTSVIAAAVGVNLFNTTASTINMGGQAANILIGNTSGTSTNVIFGGSSTNGQAAIGSVYMGNLTVNGNVTQQSAYYERFANVTNTGGNLTCNFVNGSVFYVTLTANVTVNFTNVVATAGTVVGATLIVDQGATPFSVANLQINGGGIQTIKWAGGVGSNPGTGSNTDIMSFSLINLNGTAYRVLGQIGNYG